MVNTPISTTHVSLLARLRQNPSDQRSWQEFVEQYGRHVYRWCRQWKLQDADAEDVTQIILAKLVQKLGDFQYDPSRSFRAWLKTVAHNAWRDFADLRQHSAAGAGDTRAHDMLCSIEAREDLVHRLEEAFDFELLEAAKARVRLRVAPHTWEAFRQSVLEGVPAKQVAQKMNMQVAMVYVAKSKVQRMLQEEIRKLEEGS